MSGKGGHSLVTTPDKGGTCTGFKQADWQILKRFHCRKAKEHRAFGTEEEVGQCSLRMFRESRHYITGYSLLNLADALV